MLDFVQLIDVDNRDDGAYVFAHGRDARRFAETIRDGGGDAYGSEQAVNVGDAAERIIAAERGDVLEDKGWPELAEDVREGLALETALGRLREIGEEASEAAELLRRWRDLDRE